MISTTATPPKAPKVTCQSCGLTARSPIVVANGGKGRCADRKACAMRTRRAANKRKAEKG